MYLYQLHGNRIRTDRNGDHGICLPGYRDCSVQASVRIKEQEIYIQKLVVSVPGDMDREAVAALLKAQLGLQPVVKGLGE